MATIFFYGERNENGWLSNFYPAPITDSSGCKHQTTEHYFHYCKAVTFSDAKAAAAIMAADTPLKAKRIGSKIKGYDDYIWGGLRRGVMRDALRLKAQQHAHIADMLRGTGSALIAEAAQDDVIWGIGLDAATAARTPRAQWPGLNLLGDSWMAVRAELAA